MKNVIWVIAIIGALFIYSRYFGGNTTADINIRIGTEFLAKNATAQNVRQTASGLQYKILVPGTGKIHPKATDTVAVHYHGTLIDGTVFDSTIEQGEPATFAVNGVIQGWTEGLQLMVVGEKTRFFIPSHLAYGRQTTGPIKAGSTLVFDIELLKINE